MAEENIISASSEEDFLHNFLNDQNNSQNLKIANFQDKIDRLNDKIIELTTEKKRNADTIKIYDAVISSKVLERLQPELPL